MSNPTTTQDKHPTPGADDARALLNATADAAGEKIQEARQRLESALDQGRELYGRARGKVIAGAHNADHAVREHPYQAIGIGLGIGALVGYLIARRCHRNQCD